MLREIAKIERKHGPLLSVKKSRSGQAENLAAPASSTSPERLVDFGQHLAPRNADVVQVAFGPARQFAPLMLPFTPDVQRLTEMGQQPCLMMICHR
jgi:hypothetical protein